MLHSVLPGKLLFGETQSVQKLMSDNREGTWRLLDSRSRVGNLGIAPEKIVQEQHSNYQPNKTWVSPSLPDSSDLQSVRGRVEALRHVWIRGITRRSSHTFWTGFALGLPFLILMHSRRAACAHSTARIRSIHASGTELRRGASRVTTCARRTRFALIGTGEVVPRPHCALRAVERCWTSERTVFPEAAHMRNAGGNGTEEALGADAGALRS
eukprot:890643-Prymnesium_polylepis.1